METLKVAKVEEKRGRDSGKVFYSIEFDDGRKATSFDSTVKNFGGSLVDVEFIAKGAYLNIKSIKEAPMVAPVMAPMGAGNVKPEVSITYKPSVNPVFVYLGACAMVAPIIMESIGAGEKIDEALVKAEEQFSSIYGLAEKMYKVHMTLSEYKDTAEKLMD